MTSNRYGMGAPVGALVFVIAAGCSHTVRPDSMSAEQHRQEAAKETAAAQTEVVKAVSSAPPPNLGVNPGGIPDGYFYPVDSYDPTKQHLVRARHLEEHAREHREAAQKLEKFVQDECKSFPPETRISCPMLGPVTQISDIQGGVRVHFAPNTRVDAVVAHMRCHLAYAQANGFDTSASCPLYVPGLDIRMTADGQAAELTSRDRRAAAEIRDRTRQEAILVNQ
jgi:hypothetical protein